jgi:hypothetical protein
MTTKHPPHKIRGSTPLRDCLSVFVSFTNHTLGAHHLKTHSLLGCRYEKNIRRERKRAAREDRSFLESKALEKVKLYLQAA